MKSRTEFAKRNIGYGIFTKAITLVLSFVARTIFIYVLGKHYLGVNSLYTEILKILSFTELGFGTAFTFALYKPIATNDTEKIKQLLSFFRIVYLIIAVCVAVLGLCLIPVLQYIVQGADSIAINELRLYFLIFLANTVVGYFVAYKFTYINASQMGYINSNIDLITEIVAVILQIASLLLFKNFLVFLLIKTASLIICKLASVFYLNWHFPILKERPKTKLSKQDKQAIFKEVKGLAVHQFSSIAIHSTDNIIISSIAALGVGVVGLVSNYNLIITSVTGFVLILFTSITAGIGNIYASESKSKFLRVFKELNFINAWIYGFCCTAFLCLVPPFITLWLGKEYLIEFLPFFLIVFNCYLEGQCTIYNSARIASGNFEKDKWISFSQAIINLVVSICCAIPLGLLGVYIGTVVSRLFFTIFRPIKTYHYMTGEKTNLYFKPFFKYLFVNSLIALVCYCFSRLVVNYSFELRTFVGLAAAIAIIPNVLFLLVFSHSQEYRDAFARFKAVLKRGLKK